MHYPESILENKTHKLLWDFDLQRGHLISARRPDLIIINNKKRTCRIVDFAVPGERRVKLKESEKKDKDLGLVRELKKLWNMTVTLKPIVISALGMVTKGMIQGLEDLDVGGRVETIRTTALLSGPLCSKVATRDRVLSMRQIQLNCVLMLNWIAWNRTVLTFKLRIYAELNCLKWNCFCILN